MGLLRCVWVCLGLLVLRSSATPEVVFVALHLAAGEAGKARREKHLRRAMQLATAKSATVVLFGDLNVPDAELAALGAPASGRRGPGRFETGRFDRLQEVVYSYCQSHLSQLSLSLVLHCTVREGYQRLQPWVHTANGVHAGSLPH